MKTLKLAVPRRSSWYACITMAFLHYFLTPSESGASPAAAVLIRAVSGAALTAVLLAICGLRKVDVTRLGPWTIGLFIWFALINRLQNAQLLAVMFSFMLLSFALVGCEAKSRSRGLTVLEKPLTYLVIFWVFALLLQISLFAISGQLVDLHAILHPLSEARIYGVADLFRFTGVHIEPGTYANWLYALVMLRAMISGRLYDRISLFAVLSILFALSAWGLIAVAIFLFGYFVSKISDMTKRGIRAAALAVLLLTGFGLFVYSQFGEHLPALVDYFVLRSELEDVSGSSKVQALAGFKQLAPQLFIVGMPLSTDFCGGCASPQDAGFLLNIAVYAGMLVAIALFVMIFVAAYREFGVTGALAALPLAFAKFIFYEPMFWMIFGAAVVRIRFGIGLHPNPPKHDKSFTLPTTYKKYDLNL
ncbi:hypothetical protein HHL11_22595 [Ramlibacter sp. G-1-2-2]|uniref:O-antigen ligase domain-containing protein n=1 Tax=Ramlibacter agri TaxID=2728837 RepID=A0A848HDD5_9BURK|nr:hypothetical protein [Ramlibacter agri]NML46553.1 hypothetical protein [Ramlibacter agri]